MGEAISNWANLNVVSVTDEDSVIHTKATCATWENVLSRLLTLIATFLGHAVYESSSDEITTGAGLAVQNRFTYRVAFGPGLAFQAAAMCRIGPFGTGTMD